jgi:hypothetical protein
LDFLDVLFDAVEALECLPTIGDIIADLVESRHKTTALYGVLYQIDQHKVVVDWGAIPISTHLL